MRLSPSTVRVVVAGAVLAMLATLSPMLNLTAGAAPTDPWDYGKHDCLNDRWNPLDRNGKRVGKDPVPGTPAWTAYNDSHVACTDQRDSDRNQFPFPDSARSAATYGVDRYRDPATHTGVRFQFEDFTVADIPTVPSAEAYRPCAPGECPKLPRGLQRLAGPYPVVIVMHGVIADKAQHRFNTQTFAEAGYLAIGVDGIGGGYVPGMSLPSSQRCDNASDVLDWLATPASGIWGRSADLSRVAVTGHSQGGGCSLGYQGDRRVDAIIGWDSGGTGDNSGDAPGDLNCTLKQPCQPLLLQRTDGAFATPQAYASGYPEERDHGRAGYRIAKARKLDFLHITMRDTVHTDWNGRGTGLSGNRLFEQASNYYNVAFLDRYLKGALVTDARGRVVTQQGRNVAQERAFRQREASSGFARLTAKRFPAGSIDKHNISQGFWDPARAEASGDPLYGGNVPYRIEGTWTLERLSPFYRNYCTLSLPSYLGRRGLSADSGDRGDMRLNGCSAR